MSYPDREDLDTVNGDVDALPYVSNQARGLDPAYWERITTMGGTCIDYVLEKIKRLEMRDWPTARLRIACCFVEAAVPPPDNYHAVLQIDLEDGTQAILDSRQSHVCTIDELQRIGYQPDRIQQVGGSQTWVQWLWEAS